jgi:Flp pilus assembly protein TadD
MIQSIVSIFSPCSGIASEAEFRSVLAMMGSTQVLTRASGWLDLGLADEALAELEELTREELECREALEIKLCAQMENGAWNPASETARLLCLKVTDEPMFFIHAAFCLHETGDTLAARNWLLKGPKSLFDMAVFHYNLACYLWILGDGNGARSHLRQAIAMDESFRETALSDRDLVGIGSLP